MTTDVATGAATELIRPLLESFKTMETVEPGGMTMAWIKTDFGMD